MEIKSQYEYKERIYEVTYNDGAPQDVVIGGGVHCYCFYNGKLVLVGYSNSDSWTPPGGEIEKGETYEEAAVREIKEESNMKVLWMECIGYQDVEVVRDKNIKERQYRMICIVEPYGDFESDPDNDISEIKLIDPKDYKEYIKWGEIGDHLMKRALEMKEKNK
jgi:ADP-ribose pyrophosphatase YjhB (NUDIX family)